MLIVNNARELGTLLVEAEDLPFEAFEAALLRAAPHVCEIYRRNAWTVYRRAPLVWMALRTDTAGDEVFAEVRRRYDARHGQRGEAVELRQRFLDTCLHAPLFPGVGHMIDEASNAAVIVVRLDRVTPEVRALAKEGTEVVMSLGKAIEKTLADKHEEAQEELDLLVAMLVCAAVAEKP